MRQLLLSSLLGFLCVMISQSVDAAVTVSNENGTVTITSTTAGDLMYYMQNLSDDEKNALKVNNLVLVGEFCESDFQTLQNFPYKSVDMGEAKIMSYPGSDQPNYETMKFSYWSATLEKAVTSKYADEHTSNDIFSNCKSLKEVDFKAGVIKGFGDRKADQGYAPGLKVTVGKNVSAIAQGAFQRCDILEQLVFDKDYTTGNADKLAGVTYPIPLTIAEEAFLDCVNLTGAAFPNRLISIGNSAFKHAGNNTSEFSVSFERRFHADDPNVSIDYDHDLEIGKQAFSECLKLKQLSLPVRLSSLGIGAFEKTRNLSTVEIREDVEEARLKVIPADAFLESGMTSITIPRSVEEIMPGAFQACTNLETVTFQESLQTPQPPLVIHTGAFAGGDESQYHLKDVYVNIHPQNRLLICEYNAFNFTSMESQTEVDNDRLATLHFLEEDFDYYAGAWKKGLVFTQYNLNSMKDGYRGERNGVTYVGMPNMLDNPQINHDSGYYQPGGYPTTQYGPANGWQQFAKTASDREILVKGNLYMTYSSAVPLGLPKGVLAFRVTEYFDQTTNSEGKTINGKLRLKFVQDVPINTGVILISTDKYFVTRTKDGEEISKFYFDDPSTENPSQFVHNEEVGGDATNYLVPAVHDVQVGPVSKGPYTGSNSFQLLGTSDFDHRNFGMHKTTHQFVRVKDITMPDNRAFLSLPTTLFTNDNESATEGPTPIQTSAGLSASSYDPEIQQANAQVIYDYDVETYGLVWPLERDYEEAGIINGIETATVSQTATVPQGIYTLQGVRVEKPLAKGIYIVNGKKIVVK